MFEDFGALYGTMANQVAEAGLDDVVSYLEKLASLTNKTLKENEALMKENTRLHDVNDELGVHLREQRERVKPEPAAPAGYKKERSLKE